MSSHMTGVNESDNAVEIVMTPFVIVRAIVIVRLIVIVIAIVSASVDVAWRGCEGRQTERCEGWQGLDTRCW